MENKINLESDKIFDKLFKEDASYYKFLFLLFQNLKDTNFPLMIQKKQKLI